jgi:hypothetical protein
MCHDHGRPALWFSCELGLSEVELSKIRKPQVERLGTQTGGCKDSSEGWPARFPGRYEVSLEQSRGDYGPHIHHTLCSNSCPPNGREQCLPPPGTDVHMVKTSPVVSTSPLRQKRVLLSSCLILPDGLLSRGLCFCD